ERQRLVAARLALREQGVGDVLAREAVLQQVGRRQVDAVDEGQILDIGLARAAAPADVRGGALAQAPAPGEDVDLALVAVESYSPSIPSIFRKIAPAMFPPLYMK